MRSFKLSAFALLATLTVLTVSPANAAAPADISGNYHGDKATLILAKAPKGTLGTEYIGVLTLRGTGSGKTYAVYVYGDPNMKGRVLRLLDDKDPQTYSDVQFDGKTMTIHLEKQEFKLEVQKN